jgi:hypothetical protein
VLVVQEEGGLARRTTSARSKALITMMLGTRSLLMERRNITAEPLENSPRPAAGSRLILLCFSST